MNDSKTVGVSIIDPLLSKQRGDVAQMRTSLLAIDADPKLASTAMKKITVLQVYHQMSRIIRYTELCDKLEEKLYESADFMIDSLDSSNGMMTLSTLLNLQERLQKLMIESNKILQPYLDMTSYIESVESQIVDDTSSDITISLDSTKREKLRNAASKVLSQLNVG